MHLSSVFAVANNLLNGTLNWIDSLERKIGFVTVFTQICLTIRTNLDITEIVFQ